MKLKKKANPRIMNMDKNVMLPEKSKGNNPGLDSAHQKDTTKYRTQSPQIDENFGSQNKFGYFDRSSLNSSLLDFKGYDQTAGISTLSKSFPLMDSKPRNKTSSIQLETLETVSQSVLKPDKALRQKLSVQLGMTPRQIQIWFQNKRAKLKKCKENEVGSGESPSYPNKKKTKSSEKKKDSSKADLSMAELNNMESSSTVPFYSAPSVQNDPNSFENFRMMNFDVPVAGSPFYNQQQRMYATSFMNIYGNGQYMGDKSMYGQNRNYLAQYDAGFYGSGSPVPNSMNEFYKSFEERTNVNNSNSNTSGKKAAYDSYYYSRYPFYNYGNQFNKQN